MPQLLQRHNLKIDDIGLWELNEAFAVQALYCRDQLGIPADRFNVDGGAISIGHPYGMSGARMTMHAPVSYTHLDVYKRQIQRHGDGVRGVRCQDGAQRCAGPV